MALYAHASARGLSPGQTGFCVGEPASPATRKTITTATRTSNVVTVTTSAAHLFQVGESVEIQGVAGDTVFNGVFPIASVPSSTTFTFAQTADDDATGAGGTATSHATEAVQALNAVSRAFALHGPENAPAGRTVVWSHGYNVNPSAVTLALEGAMVDADSEYVSLDTDNTAAGNTKTVAGVKHKFLRIKTTALTLGSGAGQLARIHA